MRISVHVAASALRVVALALLPGICGCAAVRKFTVTPHEICPGTRVKTDWDVTGRPTVRTSPDLPPESDRTYAPTANTDFIISAKTLLKTATAPPNTVTLYTGTSGSPREMDQPLTFRSKCIGNLVVAQQDLRPQDWDSKITIESMTSNEDREVTIEHDGKRATLTPQNPASAVFSGSRMVGSWRISLPLKSGETCTGDTPPGGLDQIAFTPSLYCGN
jgi:hypothetical protein